MCHHIRLQKSFFLLSAFLLGSIAPLYGNLYNFVLLAYLLLLFIFGRKQIINDFVHAKNYLYVPLLFLIYFSLHTLFITHNPPSTTKPAFGMFEVLILHFSLVPAYTATLRTWLIPLLLREFLLLYSLGSLALNTYVLFDFAGATFLSSPNEALRLLLDTRFGDNRSMLGGFYFLEMRAMSICVAALSAYFLFATTRNSRFRIPLCLLFATLTVYLFFTITKSALLGFIIGFTLINVRIISRLPRWHRILSIVLFLCALITTTFILSQNEQYKKRLLEAQTEIKNVRQGEYIGGTIGPRIAFIQETFAHRSEFQIWGLGVYAKNQVKTWFETSDKNIAYFNNVHNSFLQYWIIGGLPGLFFVLFLFFAPLIRSIHSRQSAWLLFAFIAVFLVVSCSCVTLSRGNARTPILFFLSLFYLYTPLFHRLESSSQS